MSIRYLIIIAAFWLSQPAVGQQINTGGDPKVDAVNFINNTLRGFNGNTVRFQALRLGLEEMHPFDAAHLDTTSIFDNLNSLSKYQQFLETFRQKTTGMLRRVTDSVGLLESRLGDTIHWKAIDRFFKNFQEESKLYVQYSLKLSNQVMATRSALIFLQTNGFDAGPDGVMVHGGKANEDLYQAQLNKIRGAAVQASDAFSATVDGTSKSNELVLGVLETLSK
ncbi:MAG TPA: hypothetical protein VEW28_09440 [Candidatus Kapabacteria bacterium]|nr:hypothetical protein [Candidatus Kapabacteria bacterium]